MKAFIFMLMVLCPAISNAQKDLTASTFPSEDRPRNNDYFKVYGGVTFSELKVGTVDYDNSAEVGFNLGLAYEHGRFFYYNTGIRYSRGLYELTQVNSAETNYFPIQSIDIPVLGGMNLLYFISRFVGLRIFAGVTPGFIVGVGKNNFDLSLADTNTFQLNGQVGLGFDVAFLFVETSYNRGFTNVFDEFGSNVSQVMVNIGIRF